MALALGTQLGLCEIIALTSASGMGDVYKARDTRLDRSVAIKVLPTQFADDPSLRDRFDRNVAPTSWANRLPPRHSFARNGNHD